MAVNLLRSLIRFHDLNGHKLAQKIGRSQSRSSARMGQFGFQVKRQLEPVLIGLV